MGVLEFQDARKVSRTRNTEGKIDGQAISKLRGRRGDREMSRRRQREIRERDTERERARWRGKQQDRQNYRGEVKTKKGGESSGAKEKDKETKADSDIYIFFLKCPSSFRVQRSR